MIQVLSTDVKLVESDGEILFSIGQDLRQAPKSNKRTNGPVNAHLISGPTISTKTYQTFHQI